MHFRLFSSLLWEAGFLNDFVHPPTLFSLGCPSVQHCKGIRQGQGSNHASYLHWGWPKLVGDKKSSATLSFLNWQTSCCPCYSQWVPCILASSCLCLPHGLPPRYCSLSPVGPLLINRLFHLHVLSAACNQGNRGGTCAIRQVFLLSGQATVAFFLTSLLWQQETHDQQNPSPCHQFLHKDSGTIHFSLGLSVNLFLLMNLDMFSLLVDCTSNQLVYSAYFQIRR